MQDIIALFVAMGLLSFASLLMLKFAFEEKDFMTSLIGLVLAGAAGYTFSGAMIRLAEFHANLITP